MKIIFNNKTYQVEGELTITEVEDNLPIPSTMQLGVNSNWSSNWDSPKYFINLARNMGFWEGEGITQRYGKILECDPDITYTAGILDKNLGVNAKAGIYHVYWGGEGTLDINGSNGITYLHDGLSYIRASFKGTRLDSLSLVHEDDLIAYKAGFEWQIEYLEYIATLPITTIRAMNWTKASECYDSLWSDRVTSDDISFNMGVPLEICIQFANHMELDLWYNFPVRADNIYINNAANIIKDTLNENLYVELGNEIWNYADPWGDGTAWIINNGSTKYLAKADSIANNFYLINHGLEAGDLITSYSVLNQEQNNTDINWRLKSGVVTEIEEATKDYFTLKYSEESIDIPKGQTQLLFSKNKFVTSSIDEHYAWKSESLWEKILDIVDTIDTHFVLASQYNAPERTTLRYAAINQKSLIDYIAIAPYYNVPPTISDTFVSYAQKEVDSFPTKIPLHCIKNIPVICYEGGSHVTAALDVDMETWLREYWLSDECESVGKKYKELLEKEGILLFCYYKDCSTTRFGLTTDISIAQKDGRYRAFIK